MEHSEEATRQKFEPKTSGKRTANYATKSVGPLQIFGLYGGSIASVT
jgi:hypothetical protein